MLNEKIHFVDGCVASDYVMGQALEVRSRPLKATLCIIFMRYQSLGLPQFAFLSVSPCIIKSYYYSFHINKIKGGWSNKPYLSEPWR